MKIRQKDYRWIIGLCLLLLVVAAVHTYGNDKDRSCEATEEESEKDTDSISAEAGLSCSRAGIEGMREYVECMEKFYRSVQTKEVTSASDEILAGTCLVNRSMINRNAFHAQAARAGELGYDAMQAIAENQMSYNDYYTLLQIVEAEATGGDIHSKQLIANVVLNRVNDPRFPDSIYDVVWQRLNGSAQFQPTADGRIQSCTITSSTIEAVENALNGEDNSEGALFFFARSHSSKENVEWFEKNLEKLFEYGGHEFFRFREPKG